MKKPMRKPAAASGVSYSTSPLLAARTPPGRSTFVVAMVALGFCGLIGRAVYIQIVGTDFYLRQGEIRYARTLDLPASRGRITDRNGQLLATSVPTPSLWAIPKDVDADPAQRSRLAGLLGLSPAALAAKLEDDSARFVWLRRQVDDDVATQVRAMNLKGVHELLEYRRQYPEGEAAAHVVGFTDVEDHGQEGIELAFQKLLAGRDGSRNVIKDRFGRIVEDGGNSVPPTDGRDLALALDSKIQFFAYQRIRDAVAEHKAKSGSVIVLDVLTGEVLALANYPSFTPGDRRGLKGEQLRNGVFTDTFEPGSTMKPFIAGLAMETGRVTPTTMIQTAPGRITIGDRVISDSHAHGMLSVAEVIQKSSNVGTVKMAMQMQPKEMWDLFTSVGIGQQPKIDFPGAVSGRLRPFKRWKPIEQATMSYGYGLSVSLFQLARAYTVFARDGEVIPISMMRNDALAAERMARGDVPGFADGLIGRAMASEKPAPTLASLNASPNANPLLINNGSNDGVATHGVRVFSPKTARAVRDMLHMVTSDGGTAPKAQTLGYSVGGKTGTAYVHEDGAYVMKKYRAWFVGLAPIQNPRVVVAVMVNEPSNGKYFGGDVAAPVFSQVVGQTLRMMGVPPDLDVKTQIIASDVKGEDESF